MYLLIAHNRAVTPDIVYYYISLSSNMANIKRRGKRFFSIILIIKFQEIIYRAFLHGRLIYLVKWNLNHILHFTTSRYNHHIEFHMLPDNIDPYIHGAMFKSKFGF